MKNEKKNVLIVEAASNGKNYLAEITARGLHPIVLYPKLDAQAPTYAKFREDAAKVVAKYTSDIIFAETDDIEALFHELKHFEPIAVVAGSEIGVLVSDFLSERFGLSGNSFSTSNLRRDKFKMQAALLAAGIPSLRSKCVSSEKECIDFARDLGTFPIVLKPLSGSGTAGVHFCESESEIIDAFNLVSSKQDIFGSENKTVLLQEFAKGTEYIVNTVSCGGVHTLTDIWQYSKVAIGSDGNAYDYARLVREPSAEQYDMIEYVKKSLTALRLKYGPAHSEVMLTPNGPRLIETGARPMGGFFPTEILMESLDHKIVDVALDSYINKKSFDDFSRRPYKPNRSVLVKYFIAPESKNFDSMPILKLIQFLPSARAGNFLDVMNSFSTARTVDLFTAAGEVILCHQSEEVLMHDYKVLRTFETEYFDMMYSSQNAIASCKIILNEEEINLFEDEDNDFESLIESLGMLSKRANVNDKLLLPDNLQMPKNVFLLLLEAFGWSEISDCVFIKTQSST